MTAGGAVPAARRTPALRGGWRDELRAVLVLDGQGLTSRVVVMFGDEESAEQWAETHQVESYRVVPAELAEPRR